MSTRTRYEMRHRHMCACGLYVVCCMFHVSCSMRSIFFCQVRCTLSLLSVFPRVPSLPPRNRRKHPMHSMRLRCWMPQECV